MKFLLICVWMMIPLNLNAQKPYSWIAGNKVIHIDTNGNLLSEKVIFEDNTIPEIIPDFGG